MGLLTTDDFSNGFFKLLLDKFGKIRLEQYLIEFDDDQFLAPLFGKDEYAKYKADLDGNFIPQTAPYTTVFNALCDEVDPCDYICKLRYDHGKLNHECKELLISKGIKDMLKGFVYYNYLYDPKAQQTPVGVAILDSANSNAATDDQIASEAEARWNRSIHTYRSIQKYIAANETDFPDFAGFPMYFKMEGIF